MKINQRIVTKFQDGGAAPSGGAPQGGGPAPADPSAQGGGGGQDPVMQLAQLAQQAIQGQDCQAALAVCQGFMTLIQSAQGQGAPADGSGAAQGAPSGQPVYRKGGKLIKRITA